MHLSWQKVAKVGMLLAAVLSPVGCGEDPVASEGGARCSDLPPLAPRSSYRIGFAQVYEANQPWRKANTESIQSEAARRGHELVFDPGSDFGADGQAARMRALIEARVDAIIVAPQDPTVLAPTIVAARKACIPVFLEDRQIDPEVAIPGVDYVSYIGSDFALQGARTAQWLVAHPPPGKPVVILEIEGTVGSSPAVARKQGFDDEIARHPEMRIVASETANFSRTEGHDVARSLLVAHPDATVLYAHNDAMALGAIEALEELGRVPGKDVTILSIDGQKEAVQALLDGKIAAIAECSPRFGPACFDAIEHYGAGQKLPLETRNTDRLFDITNAAAYLPEAY